MSIQQVSRFFLLVIICSIGWAATTYAQQNTHRVTSGETLYSIAKEYKVTVKNLREWNNLQSNELEVGQSLVVKSPAKEEAVTHIVKAEETLFSISKNYGVSITEIKTWNNLSGNTLEIGQKLKIFPDIPAGSNKETRKSIVVTNTAQQNTYYTVKSGDTLYQIARAHNMTVSELKELNDLTSNTIAVGQRLTVRASSAPPSVAESSVESSPQGKFVSYSIRETQSLEDILTKFRMDEQEFKALNPDISATSFQPGQKVTVLAPASKSYTNPYKTDASLKNLGETAVSRYSTSEKSQTTTSGELYSPAEITAAHSNIALGTVIFIENPANKKGIYIRINDRISGNGLKLSDAAWQALDFSASSPMVNIYQDQ